jgi:hypothetical protein
MKKWYDISCATLKVGVFNCSFSILGLNQLLWYYADMEKQRCPNATTTFDPKNPSDPDACVVWRRFAK